MKGDIPLFDLSGLGTEATALGINVGASPFSGLAAAGLMGPGAHREDDPLDYMPMPREMTTFEIPLLPEVEELAAHPEAGALLDRLQALLDAFAAGELDARPQAMDSQRLGLDGIDPGACALLYQTLGEGEVALMIQGPDYQLRVQETVLAGVWWIQQADAAGQLQQQWLEVGAIPQAANELAFAAVDERSFEIGEPPAGLLNGASVMVELLDQARRHHAVTLSEPYVVNLSLLPFSVEDHQWLGQRLGYGRVVILSRGYGNCRISSTTVAGIWRVQYFNSTDQLILDTLEVVQIPQVACAAREDLEDSAARLREIHAALQA